MAQSRKKAAATRPAEDHREIRTALEGLAHRLGQTGAMRPGSIMFRLSGEEGGDFCLDCTPRGANLAEGAPRDAGAPLIEVIGDVRVIRSILERKRRPARFSWPAGFRVRGDLKYLTDVAMELGLLEEPI